MQDSTFIQRVKKELPLWVKNGWVLKEHQQAILESLILSDEQQPTGIIPFTVIWIGVLLLGAGIVTFFVSNWAHMQPIMKLQLLLGSLGILYLLAAVFFFIASLRSPLTPFKNTMGQTLLALGGIVFGANIFLIADLYNIQLHYPTGVLIWALMALFTACLMHTQIMLIISILLTMLWSAMEMFDFQHSIHWSFLSVWILFLFPIVQEQWVFSLKVALIALFTWSLGIMALYVGDVFFIQIYFLSCLSLFLFGEVLKTYSFTALFSNTIQRFSCFFASLSLFALTFPTNITKERGLFFDIVPTFGYPETLSAILLVVGMMSWIAWRSKIIFNTTSFIWGQGWLFLALLMILFNTHLGSSVELYKGLIATAYNVLFFTGIGWVIYVGYRECDRVLLNLGFLYLAIGLLSRYFDSFWVYPNRTVFFMVGGVLLTFGSYFLETQRRGLIRAINKKYVEALNVTET